MRKLLIFCLTIALFASTTTVFAAEASNFTENTIEIGPYELEGRLAMPNSAELPPVAIFIHGSGQADFDSAFGGMTFFRDIAFGLAEQGIASIRFNKRFYQHAPLPGDATIFTETIDDVMYAIEYAAARDDLGPIFLIGFSQGGIVAPYIAFENEDVAGIVSLAGSPRNFLDILTSQSQNGFFTDDIPFARLIRQIMIVDEKTSPMMYNLLNAQATQMGFPISFLRSMDTINTYELLPHIDIPFLILQGDMDLQISAQHCFAAWEDALYGRENAKFILYEGLNHFFAPHMPQYGSFQQRAVVDVDKRVAEDIAEWILEVSSE